jgi:phosphopantetheinyl transferase (holo-ACP synthase)
MFTRAERARPARLAEAFAIKEAALKAIGGLTGWELDWREIEAEEREVKLSGSVAKHAKKLGVGRVHASVMTEAGAVLATAIAERV